MRLALNALTGSSSQAASDLQQVVHADHGLLSEQLLEVRAAFMTWSCLTFSMVCVLLGGGGSADKQVLDAMLTSFKPMFGHICNSQSTA
jgi:hypothetical protein